jgi:sulfate transport system permease protein
MTTTPSSSFQGQSAALREPFWVQALLLGLALSFFALFLLLPVGLVFTEGAAQRLGFVCAGADRPRRLSAIKLTLIAAAIAVPLNVVFGVAAAWSIAKFDFRGKTCW